MRIALPETDASPYVSRYECNANHEHLSKNVEENREMCQKILRILQGNGEGGLIWKVNTLMLRNQWADKLVTIGLTIITNLIVLYITGKLNL